MFKRHTPFDQELIERLAAKETELESLRTVMLFWHTTVVEHEITLRELREELSASHAREHALEAQLRQVREYISRHF